ncbi:MAG: hypothetical protein H6668_02500 [Ardenticatenaceae bacterium]|nr:hypothetical protein [Ardenticatenaceae bacterium]
MGASYWSHFTSYQENIEQALHCLQVTVLATGDYYLACSPAERIAWLEKELARPFDEQFGFASHGDEETRDELHNQAIFDLKWLQDNPDPKVYADKLRQIEMINGFGTSTHSILDIYQVAAEPAFGSASPMSCEEQLAVFGTIKPTKELINENAELEALISLMERWTGRYVIIYKEDLPHEIWFCGVSGD